MRNHLLAAAVLAAATSVLTATAAPNPSLAQMQQRDQDRLQSPARDQMRQQDREHIYGNDMMTEQERDAYRNRMRSAQTLEERQRIQEEHRKEMQDRARQRGVTLPDDMPMPGPGMGQGQGMGPGMGGRGPAR